MEKTDLDMNTLESVEDLKYSNESNFDMICTFVALAGILMNERRDSLELCLRNTLDVLFIFIICNQLDQHGRHY